MSQAPEYQAMMNPIDSQTTIDLSQTSIEIKDLQCQRQPNRQKSLSLTLLPNQPHVIYGKSGSGKTSLLETLAGELDPVRGEIIAQGINLLSLPDEVRYQNIAFLGQSDQLINVSIREFLSLGLTSVSDEKLKSALAAVGLTKNLEETPEILNYMLGVRGNRVSGGQARRLHLACLLLREPKLVLLDEPFRGLERALIKSIIENITPWMANKCVIFVAHDPSAIPSHWPTTRWP